MARPFLSLSTLVLLAGCTGSAAAPGRGNSSPERAALIARIDSIILAPINAGKVAGAGVAVVKGADTILIRGYGKADLEFDIPMPDDAMFEIGSVTKGGNSSPTSSASAGGYCSRWRSREPGSGARDRRRRQGRDH